MSDKSKIKIRQERLVSIIIAFQKPGDYLWECLAAIKRLHYQNYEVILLPDEPMEGEGEGITIIPTGPVGPPLKRDIGAREANGEIIAFIDDDAYPQEDWLKTPSGILVMILLLPLADPLPLLHLIISGKRPGERCSPPGWWEVFTYTECSPRCAEK